MDCVRFSRRSRHLARMEHGSYERDRLTFNFDLFHWHDRAVICGVGHGEKLEGEVENFG